MGDARVGADGAVEHLVRVRARARVRVRIRVLGLGFRELGLGC